MNNRSEHMQRVNKIRSDLTYAMIFLLDELDEGRGGDYMGFKRWGIKNDHSLKGQLNSYRAQKIAQFLGQTINKQKLLKYSKPKGYTYRITNIDIMKWLNNNEEALRKYYEFDKGYVMRGEGRGKIF